MIKVAVTQRVDYIEGYKETRDAIDQKLPEWIILSGLLPVPISNKLVVTHCDKGAQAIKQPILQDWLSTIKPNAVIISGGNDIGEYPARDETEKYLLKWAQENRTPVLGICRGMQMMACHAGTQLVPVEGHAATRHGLKYAAGFQQELPEEVNSYHNWRLANCPNGFETLATSQDGTIEAIRHKSLPWEGWMWHPEREEPFSTIDSQRFNKLLGNE